MAIFLQLSRYKIVPLVFLDEHIRTSDCWNTCHTRLFAFACYADLGLESVGEPAEVANYICHPVFMRLSSSHNVRSARRFVNRICSNPSLPVLRSVAAQDISNRNVAISRRICLWS